MSGEMELPDPGKGRRWRIAKERSRSYSMYSSCIEENERRPWAYEIFLEEYVPGTVGYEQEKIYPPWYAFWSEPTYKKTEVQIPEKWVTIYTTWIPDLIDKNLVETANLILEKVKIIDETKRVEASRLGTYPPKKLSDTRKELANDCLPN